MGEIELQILEDEADEEADEDEDVESDDDSNNTGDRETAPNVTYDKSLPGTHSVSNGRAGHTTGSQLVGLQLHSNGS